MTALEDCLCHPLPKPVLRLTELLESHKQAPPAKGWRRRRHRGGFWPCPRSRPLLRPAVHILLMCTPTFRNCLTHELDVIKFEPTSNPLQVQKLQVLRTAPPSAVTRPHSSKVSQPEVVRFRLLALQNIIYRPS